MMKKPIDPNLDNLMNLNLPDDKRNAKSGTENSNSANPSSIPNKSEPHFTIEEVKKKQRSAGGSVAGNNKNSTKHSTAHHAPGTSLHHHSSNLSSHHHSSGGTSHHSSESNSHHQHSHHSKKMPAFVKFLIAIIAIILAIVLAFGGVFVYLHGNGKNDMKTITQNAKYEKTMMYNGEEYIYNDDIVSIAFIGIDKEKLGLENDVVGTGGQADADIVVAINTKTGKTTAIAVPRDTMVDVDLYSASGNFVRTEEAQLCLSYAYGNGKDSSAKNVLISLSRALYNIPISKYFALDLEGITALNDSIGGVTIVSNCDFDDYDIKKGDIIHLEGDLTEAYVRTRDMDNINASLERSERQIQYAKAFVAQLLPSVKKNFSTVNKLYNTASIYSTTNISLSNTTYLASLLISKGTTNFDTTMIEGKMKKSGKGENARAEFYPDKEKLKKTVIDTFYIKKAN